MVRKEVRGRNQIKTVTKSMLKKWKLKGKPQCPYCEKPLLFGYSDLKGHANQKCPTCGRSAFVDYDNMIAYQIVEDQAAAVG